MTRLLRPYIPIDTRCRVAMRQIGEMWPDEALKAFKGNHSQFLEVLLKKLSELLGSESLHLDHDPALGAREKVYRRGEHVGYRPDANDPEHMIYRDKRAHQIKTNIRGDGAQHPDRVLIKRERRRNKKRDRPKRPWPTRKFPRRIAT